MCPKVQDTMSKSIVLTMMAETGCRSVRPSPAMPLRIILGISVDISVDGMTIICGSPGEYGV